MLDTDIFNDDKSIKDADVSLGEVTISPSAEPDESAYANKIINLADHPNFRRPTTNLPLHKYPEDSEVLVEDKPFFEATVGVGHEVPFQVGDFVGTIELVSIEKWDIVPFPIKEPLSLPERETNQKPEGFNISNKELFDYGVPSLHPGITVTGMWLNITYQNYRLPASNAVKLKPKYIKWSPQDAQATESKDNIEALPFVEYFLADNDRLRITFINAALNEVTMHIPALKLNTAINKRTNIIDYRSTAISNIEA